MPWTVVRGSKPESRCCSDASPEPRIAQRSEYRPTSKMSHDGTWRASCRISIHIPSFHLESTFQSTRRDKSRRWLWRLVGHVQSKIQSTSPPAPFRNLTISAIQRTAPTANTATIRIPCGRHSFLQNARSAMNASSAIGKSRTEAMPINEAVTAATLTKLCGRSFGSGLPYDGQFPTVTQV